MKKVAKKTLLEQAAELEPKPYISRTGWDQHPLDESLDITLAYMAHKVSATAYTKVITGQSKATNTQYIVGMILGKAYRAGLLKKVKKRSK